VIISCSNSKKMVKISVHLFREVIAKLNRGAAFLDHSVRHNVIQRDTWTAAAAVSHYWPGKHWCRTNEMLSAKCRRRV